MNRARSGMAIVIALVLSSVMLVSALYLYRAGREYRFQLHKSIRELQAQFLAAGAIQHAELKVRFFPTELYDASEYSQGKNPYFDFTELNNASYTALDPIRRAEYGTSVHVHKAGPFNLGPRFITEGVLKTDDSVKWSQLSSLSANDYDPANFTGNAANWFGTDGWPKEEDGLTLVRNSDLYMWKYRQDLSNRNTIQPALCLNKNVTVDPYRFEAATDLGTPYEGMYEVTKLKVLSVAGQRRFNEEAVNFTVVATIWDPATNQPYSHRLEKVLRVKR